MGFGGMGFGGTGIYLILEGWVSSFLLPKQHSHVLKNTNIVLSAVSIDNQPYSVSMHGCGVGREVYI